MFIVDGIAYAGEPTPVMGVKAARVVADRVLLVTFSTGEERLFDATVLLDKPVYAPLSDPQVFADFAVDHEILTWENGDIDVATEFVYDHSYAYVSPAAA